MSLNNVIIQIFKFLALLLALIASYDLAAQIEKTNMTTVSAKSEVEFSDPNELENWIIVNDTVMGGRSRAGMDIQDGFLLFGGILSLQNNGGFASMRRIYSPPEWTPSRNIEISVMGDGRDYQLRLRTGRSWDGVAYVANFSTEAGELKTMTFSLDDFSPQYRGRLVRGARELAFDEVSQLGLMLADKTPGEFFIKVKSIRQLPEII